MRRNFSDSNKVKQLIAPVSSTTNPLNSASVDLKDCDQCGITVQTGATVDGGLTAQIQESEDNVTFAAIPDAAGVAIPADALAASKTYVYEIDARLRKRYVRLALVIPGASLVSAAATTTRNRDEPITQDADTTVNQKYRTA